MSLNFNIDLNELQSLDLNDAGSWPTPIKVVAIIILSALVLAAGFWFDTQGQLDRLAQAEQKEVQLRETFKARQLKAINLDAYKQQMLEMERSFGAMLRQLPSKTEVAELLVDVSQAGLANGLEFELFKPDAEAPAEFYVELPINIQVTGTYHDFGRFISDVAALPRIVTLHDISMAPARNSDQKGLVMSAKAKTYRYLEEEEE